MSKAEPYMADVHRYDPSATEEEITKIVNYLGVALLNKDASLVSCSDEAERNRVRDGYAAKKLGLDKDAAEALIEKVCQAMKEDRQKKRVTFLHLMNKHV